MRSIIGSCTILLTVGACTDYRFADLATEPPSPQWSGLALPGLSWGTCEPAPPAASEWQGSAGECAIPTLPSREGRLLQSWDISPDRMLDFASIASDPATGAPSVFLQARTADLEWGRLLAFSVDGAVRYAVEEEPSGYAPGPPSLVDLATGSGLQGVWTDTNWPTGSLVVADLASGVPLTRDGLAGIGNQDVGFASSGPGRPPVLLTPAGSFSASGDPLETWPTDNQAQASLIRVWSDPTSSLGTSVATSLGIWDSADGSGDNWPDDVGYDFQGGQLDLGQAGLVHGGLTLTYRDAATGAPIWSVAHADAGYRIAAGDIDGDGAPEICASVGERMSLFTSAGELLWQGSDHGRRAVLGSCTLADLDGDRAMEVVDWSSLGLAVYDGASGDLLWSDSSVAGANGFSSPAVAWLGEELGTGIAIAGYTAEEVDSDDLAHIVRIYVGADQPWVKSRAFWSGPNYAWRDFRDDNTVSWLAHANAPRAQSFRAQPALVGNLPDLTPVLVSDCKDDELLHLVATVANRGNSVSATGTTLTALALGESGWEKVASVDVPGTIEPGWQSAGVQLDVPIAYTATTIILEVMLADPATECNPDDDAVVVHAPE